MKLAQKLGIGLFAAVLTIAGAAEAAPVTINFDDLVIGAYPAHVDVTNQYAAQGVIFSGSGYPEALFFGSGLIVAQYPYISGPNSGFIGTSPVTATFSSDVSNVSLVFADTEIGTLLGTMTAYDSLGNFLGSVTRNSTFDTSFDGYHTSLQTLSLNYFGIHSVVFSTDNDGAVVDNLTFNTADVPAPGALALLGLGLVGLLRRKRA